MEILREASKVKALCRKGHGPFCPVNCPRILVEINQAITAGNREK